MYLEGLEDYMLPCTNKQIFGIECLGCGAQRAAAFLFRGEFTAAFLMYPAIYPLLFFAVFLLFDMFLKFRYSETTKLVLVLATLILIIGNYVFKHFL